MLFNGIVVLSCCVVLLCCVVVVFVDVNVVGVVVDGVVVLYLC